MGAVAGADGQAGQVAERAVRGKGLGERMALEDIWEAGDRLAGL